MSKSSDHLTERSLVDRCVRAIPITHSVAMAAGQDAGNRLMRKGSRKAWSSEDYNAAARESNRIALVENKQAMDEAMRNAFGSHRAKRQFAEVPADPSAWGHLTERSGECVQAPDGDTEHSGRSAFTKGKRS